MHPDNGAKELDNPQVQGIIIELSKDESGKYGVSNPQCAKGKINNLRADLPLILKEICPRGNNKVVILYFLIHDEGLLFMLELY